MKDQKKRSQKVMITGIAGSGGSFLAEHIVKNYPEKEIHGISRWHSTSSDTNLQHIKENIIFHECDLCDFSSILSALKEVRPNVIFHIASHANVRASFKTPLSVIENNIMGTVNLLEAIRSLDFDPIIQLCSTSVVYGQVDPKNVPISPALRPIFAMF